MAIEASVSDFVRFVGATTPSARINAVTSAKEVYDPAHDFYRGLRRAIQRGHEGDLDRELLQAVERAHPRRQQAYEECAAAYAAFMRRRTVNYVGRPRAWRWTEGDLTLRVNPEILADVGRERLLLKLWFSAQPLGRQGQQALLHILRGRLREDWIPGILLVRSRRVIKAGAPIPHVEAFLGAEADAFVGLWRRLG
jgi:hypothetical protein